jgi:drug/metabolite transporter (DMT)-like permease
MIVLKEVSSSKNFCEMQSFDKLGIGLSVLCLLHCIFLPILLAIVPLLTGSIGDSFFHGVLLIVIAPLAMASWSKGLRKFELSAVLVLGLTGLSFLLGALWVPEGTAHSTVTCLGGMLVVIAHWLNLKSCSK